MPRGPRGEKRPAEASPRNWFLAGSGFAFKMQICVLIRGAAKTGAYIGTGF